MTATMTYRIKGTTDDVTTCGQCGREDLKSTVVMAILDADSNEEDVTYMGSDCAAKAAQWTQAKVRKDAHDADKAADTAFHQWQDARHRADMAASTVALARLGLARTPRNMDVVAGDETYQAEVAAWVEAHPAPAPSARVARMYAH